MSNRLNQEREKELQPERMRYAILSLDKIGITPIVITETKIEFEFQGSSVVLYPYSGWHTGKSIKDGRGIEKLLKQLTK